jgi:hypothetical protein
MPSHLQPPPKQSSLGKRQSQEDLARDSKRFMEEDTAAQWKLQRNKRKMEQKRPYVEREVRMRLRIFCCYCQVKTGREKGQCLQCGHGGCGDCLFTQRLGWESTKRLERDADSSAAQANLRLDSTVKLLIVLSIE